MFEAWYIDSLNAPAGLAFACRRAETLLDGETMEDVQTYHIAAPTFVPQQVASRSVALAAERWGFQLGLFDEEGEVSFQTLQDVAEFVRRAYLASGRGRPSPGGTPVPSDIPPEFPPAAGVTGSKPFLYQDVQNMARRAKKLSRGESLSITWTGLGDVFQGGFGDAEQVLRRGGVILLRELLSRFPTNLDPEALCNWSSSTREFAIVLMTIGLYDDFESDSSVERISRSFLRDAWSKLERKARSLSAWRMTWSVLRYQTTAPWAEFRWGDQSFPQLPPRRQLSQLPVPRSIGEAAGLADPALGDVSTLVSVALGSPQVLLADPEIGAILFFAACRIVSVHSSSFAPQGAELRGEWHDATSQWRRRQMFRAAAEWLRQNLPTVVYYEQLEEILRAAGLPQPERKVHDEKNVDRATGF